MRHAGKSLIVAASLVCTSCIATTKPLQNPYTLFKPGMSFETAKSIADDVADNVIISEDESESGEKYQSIFLMYRGPLASILFVGGRATIISFDYYFLPHQQPGAEYSVETCDSMFSSAKAEISIVYGPPTKNEAEGNARSASWNTEIYKITLSEFIDTGYRLEINKPICGEVKAVLFDGNEAKWEAFQKKVDQSKPLGRIDKHNSAGTTK